ncbi:hypothetical protein MTO96_029617 [Rhipicephalus appendiculatus]
MTANNDRGVMRDGGKTTATWFVYTAEEPELLRNLVVRHRSVIENKRTDNVSKRAKDVAWEKVTEEYNSQPGAAALHMATRLPNPYDSDGAHTSQPVLSLPPARIFENMVTGSEDYMEELLGEGRIGKTCQHVAVVLRYASMHVY